MDLIPALLVLLGTAIFFFGRSLFWKKPLHIASLAGKHVFITGGSSGIGLALAHQALSEGAYVTITGRNSATLKKAKDNLSEQITDAGHRINTKVADVGDYKVMSECLNDAFAWKPIDVLICNAGLTRSGYLDKLAVEDLDLIVRTNTLGVLYATHAVLPLMKKRSPDHPMAIVLMSSLASLFLLYGNTVYTGTKYAMKGIAESLRLELIPYSIKVNLICPGFVQTPLLDDLEKADELQSLVKQISLYNRDAAQTPEEVAVGTMNAIKQGSSIVTVTPVLGPILLTLCRGFMPGDSFGRAVLEILVFPPLRLFTLFSQSDMHRRILAFHRKHSVE